MKSTGTGYLLLSDVLASNISTDVVWNSNGSCTATGPLWTITASTHVDSTIKGITVDGQADIVISGDDHTVRGEVSVYLYPSLPHLKKKFLLPNKWS